MSDTNSTQLLQSQITALQALVSQLIAEINGLSAGCTARHRLNLTAEITRIDNELINLCKKIEDTNTVVGVNTELIEKINYKLAELEGRVNILVLKVDDVTGNIKKSREQKTNFIIEVLIIVLATIITSVLGFVVSKTWTGINTADNTGVPQIINTPVNR